MDGLILKDLNGNERTACIGALIRVNRDGAYVGRLTPDSAFGGLRLHPCGLNRVLYAEPIECTLISNDPPETAKDEDNTLAQRRTSLLNNLGALRRTGAGIDRLYTLLFYYCDQREHAWFWQGVAESIDDPRQLSYAPAIEFIDSDSRRRRCSMKKFLAGPAKKHGLELSDTDIEAISNAVGQRFPSSNAYEFQIVSGIDGIRDGYGDIANSAWGSCMHDTGRCCAKPYVDWYGENPDVVSLIKILRGDTYVGRALLWSTVNGERVVDRCYPSDNGPHTTALHAFAEKNGWDYKTRQACCDGELKSGKNYAVRMKASESGEYPYCDTFKYTSENPAEGGSFQVRTCDGDYCFNTTDGGYEGGEEMVRCRNCNVRVGEHDACLNDITDYYYCQPCYDGIFVHLEYTLPSGRIVCTDVFPHDCATCEHCGEIRSNDHCDDVSGDTWCLICIEDHAFCCEDCDCLLSCDECADNPDANICRECNEERQKRESAAEREAEAVEDRKQEAEGAVTSAPAVDCYQLAWSEFVVIPSPVTFHRVA